MPDDPNFAIPSLMKIDTRRADAFSAAHMRWDFQVPGPMVIQAPVSDADGAEINYGSPTDHGFSVVGAVVAGSVVYGELVADVEFLEWTLVSDDDVEGLIELDIAVTTDGSTPTSADSIVGGNYPAISTPGVRASGTTFGWDKIKFSAGDKFAVHVRSLTDIQSIYFTLTDCV
jgi:hypothetical protein